jgi:hypothetical protein
MAHEGVYMAGTLAKVINGHVLTSILNTREEEVEIVEPPVEQKEIDNDVKTVASASTVQGKSRHRNREVLERLRMEHLNPEEKESLKRKYVLIIRTYSTCRGTD